MRNKGQVLPGGGGSTMFSTICTKAAYRKVEALREKPQEGPVTFHPWFPWDILYLYNVSLAYISVCEFLSQVREPEILHRLDPLGLCYCGLAG